MPFDQESNLEATIAEIREQWRERQDHHKEEKSLTLRIKARCRRSVGGDKKEADILYKAMMGDKKVTHPLSAMQLIANSKFLSARQTIEDHRHDIEKQLIALVKKLPVTEWWVSQRGLNYIGLAGIIGECGDLFNYHKKEHLWKRMGVGLVKDQTGNWSRQRRVKGVDALDHGFSPARRALLWTVGQAIKMSGGDNGYRQVYLQEKERQVQLAEESGLTVAPSAKIPEREKDQYISLGHIDNRAKRYMEKRLLQDLLKVWKADGQIYVEDNSTLVVPSAA